jgi:hypothetical protein
VTERDKKIQGLKTEKDSEVGAVNSKLELVTNPRDTVTTASETCVNLPDQNTKSTQLTTVSDKIPRSENDLVEEEEYIREYGYKSEQHSEREEAEEDMPAKEKITDSLVRKLCVQTQEAEEGGAEDAAFI